MEFNATPSTENTLKAKTVIENITNITGARENEPKTDAAADSTLKNTPDKEKVCETIAYTKSMLMTKEPKENIPNMTTIQQYP